MAATKKRYRDFFAELYFRGVEVIGIFVFFLAMSSVVALISYCPEDPSFNTAIGGEASNLLSFVGSYYADIMMQVFGVVSYVFSAILLSFGYQLIKYHVISFYRIVLSVISCVLGSVILAACSIKYLSSGFVGKIIWDFIKQKVELSQFDFWIFIGGLAVVFIFCLVFATRFHFSTIVDVINSVYPSEEDNEEDIEISDFEEENEEPVVKKTPSSQRKSKETEPMYRHDGFTLPSIELLKEPVSNGEKLSESELKARASNLIGVLGDFGINGEITGINPGPVVTLYELKPAAGIKSSRVIGLSNDIARYMSAVSARVAVIPGRNALGI